MRYGIKLKKHKEQLLENKLSDINHAKGNAQMFKAVKMLNKKQYENPSFCDKKGKSITNKQEIDTQCYKGTFFKSFF